MRDITVGVLAHNEENTILGTLESILNQDYQGNMKAVVCANGCTDSTAEKVREFHDVALIETNIASKPHAWNLVRESADTDYIFFADADVMIGKSAFSYMMETLLANNLVAVGAKQTATKQNGCLAHFMSRTPFPQQHLIGKLYCINRKKLDEVLGSKGFTTMPQDLVIEDFWLTIMIGKRDYAVDYRAEVHFHPYVIEDFYRLTKRNISGYLQIKRSYGEHIQNNQILTQKEKFSLIAENFKKNPFEAPLNLLAYFIRRPIIYAAYLSARKEHGIDSRHWETAQNTKKKFKNPITQ